MSEDKKPKKEEKSRRYISHNCTDCCNLYIATRHIIFITFIQSIRKAQMSIMRLPRWR